MFKDATEDEECDVHDADDEDKLDVHDAVPEDDNMLDDMEMVHNVKESHE